MIGRWLCRFGWHRWAYYVGVDLDASVTVARCSRRNCPRAGRIDVIDWEPKGDKTT